MVFDWGYWRHVGVDGLFSVYLCGYSLTSIKPNDDSSRAAHPSTYGSTARSSLISFHNENEFMCSEAVLTKPTIKVKMLLNSNHFLLGLSPQIHRLQQFMILLLVVIHYLECPEEMAANAFRDG